MTFSEWSRKKKQEEEEKGMRETASPSVEWENDRSTTTSTTEAIRDASSFGEWTRRKRELAGIQESAVQDDPSSWPITPTDSVRAEGSKYLTTARNAATTVIPSTSTVSDDDRKKRMAELEAEISSVNDTIRRKQAGLSRAVGGGATDVLQADYATLKKLQEEYNTLERSGEHTAAQELEWNLSDAQKKVTETSNAVPEVSRNAVAAWRNNPELQSEYNQKAQEQIEAKRALELLERESDLQDYVAKVDSRSYEDKFWGQANANAQLGRLNQDANEAFARYIQNPSEENRKEAYAKDALVKEFQDKHATILDDEGAVLPWLSKDAAGYMPQFIDQAKAEIGGGVLGAAAGFVVGNPKSGWEIGSSLASGVEMYEQTRGSVYRTLVAAGVDEETARQASMEESLLSAVIESGLSYAGKKLNGTAKLGNILTNVAAVSNNPAIKAAASTLSKSAVDKAAKVAAKEAGKSALRKGVDLAGGVLVEATSEAVEEGLQQGVSIANMNRDTTGLWDLAQKAAETLKNALTGEDEAALEEIKEAAGTGFRIGLMFGGTTSVVKNVGSSLMNAKTNKQRSAIVDAVVEDNDVLSALVEEGKASGEGSVSAKIAAEIEKDMAAGKPVTRQQVEKLIASNEVYIQEENKAAEQTAKASARATEAADAKKLGYGEYGVAALKKLSEGQEMAVDEVNAEFHLPYLKGLSNMDMKDAGITTETQREAFNAGKMDRIMSTNKDVENAKYAKVSSQAGFDYSSPHIPKTMSKATQDVYNDFSKALGTRTTVLEKIAVGSDESGANAIILGDGSIGLSADTDIAKSPTYFFHEGLHRMKQLAPAETRDFINAVVASTISDGATSSVEAMQNFAAKRNVNLTVDSAMEEIAADRAGEMFGGDVERAQAILRDVMGEIEAEAKKNGKTETEAKAHAKNVVQKFIDAIRSVIQSLKEYLSKNKSRMSKESRSDFEAAISDLTAEEKLWKDALKAAVKNAQDKAGTEQKNTTQESGEVRYELKHTKDGRKYAEITLDQHLFDGQTTAEMQVTAKNEIKSRFKGKVIGTDYTAYVDKTGSEHFAYPASRRMDENIKRDKMRTSTELDTLMAASVFRENVEPEAGKHLDAVGGLDKLDVMYRVNKTRMYEGEITVKVTKRGRVFYDMTKIKDITDREVGQVPAEDTAETESNAFSLKVAENGSRVKPNLTEAQQKNYNYNQKQIETGSTLKTLKGSAIKRSKYGVGKEIGGTVYMHKDYATDVIPAETYREAADILSQARPDFEYNAVMWNPTTGAVRFDQAPDFDTAREPIVGNTVTVNPETGAIKDGHSDYIWHHKWIWVKNDYKGFDVREAWEWSKQWLSTLPVASDGNGIERWNAQLDTYGLPRADGTKPDSRFSLKAVDPVQPKSDKWQRGHTEAWFVEQGFPLYRDVSEEQAAANADTGQTTRGGKHGTQITSTKQTYEQLFKVLQAEHPNDWQNLRVLDASSGLGLGTRIGRNMGFNVTDIEPFPSENDYMYDKAEDGAKNPHPGKFHPNYTDYSLLQQEVDNGETEGFDFIISNAVLNVIPQDTRDNLVVAMGDLLKPGGQMFINVISRNYDGARNSKPEIQRNAKGIPTGAVRTAEGDYSTDGNITGRGHETFVWKSNSVQKVFSYNELVAYLEDALGNGYAVEPYKKLGMTAALVTKDEGARFSLKDEDVQTAINQSMTMAQAKDMVQRAFVLGEIKEWFEDEYRNGDEWLKGEGVDAVAMVIDNEYQLQLKYLNKIQGLMDEDFFTTDILEAYLAGTLTGKQAQDNKPKRLNVSTGVNATDDRFYAPHEIENVKVAFETASQKVTNKNRDAVYKARADVIMFAHTRGAAEALGLTQSELNKKLSTWARYTARAKETSERFNAGVADWNKWTGIENSNILTRSTVSNEDLDRLVGEITGDSDGFQRKYIMRTMLALDTHIDYTGLNFEFVRQPDSKKSSVNGQYMDSVRKIRVKYNAPNTVAHEMGHYLDYQWARDIGLHGALTESRQGTQAVSGDVKVWHDHFMEFIDSLTDGADLYSSYTMDNKEVFARFVDRFVRWVNFTANGEQDRADYFDRNDKFTAKHYIEFVRLLQEKSLLDGKKQSEAQFSMKGQDDLLKENAKLKEVNAALKEQFKTTKFAQTDKKSLDAFAKKLLQDYQSGADIDETRDALNDLYNYMANGEEGNAPAWNEVQRRAYDTAVAILEEASTVNDDMYREYKDLRKRLKTSGMTINPMYDHDLMGYESINEFRKANFGRIKLVKNGTPVDVAYQDLAYAYPEFFDDTEYTTQPDQLLHIVEVLDSLQPYEVNPYSYNMREAATWLANDIIERFYELPQAKPTFADKAQQRLTKQVIKDAKKLERLRDTKNERIAKLIEANREKILTTQEKERVKREKAVEKVKESYKNKDLRSREARTARELRERIAKHAAAMSKKLLAPTDKSNVPENLRGAVATLLDAINLESNYTYDPESGSYKKNDDGLPTRRTKAFEELRKAYQQIIADDSSDMVIDPALLGEKNDGIDSMLDYVVDLKNTRIADMNTVQLDVVWKVLRAVEASVNNAGRMLAQQKYETTKAFANAFVADTESRIGKKSITESQVSLDLLTPYTYFSRYGQAGKDFFRMLRNAQDRQQVLQDELFAAVQNTVSTETRENLEKETVDITTSRGDKLTLSKAHAMEIYLLSKREAAKNHLLGGGIIQPKAGKVRRGSEAVLLNESDIAKIIGKLSDEERALADNYRNLTKKLAAWGNEASVEAFGYEKFSDPTYWPIKSAKEQLAQTVEKGQNRPRSIQNMGAAKPLTPHAANTLEIGGVFSTFDLHATEMLTYASWLIPMMDANRLFNFKFRDDGDVATGKTMSMLLNRVGGANSDKYWLNLMKDIQNGIGGDRDSAFASFVESTIGNVKKASVAGNLRVVVQQFTAYMRAAAVLNPDNMTLGIGKGVTEGRGWTKAMKYAPIAARKAAGGFEMSASPAQLAEQMYAAETKGGKVKQAVKDSAFYLAGKADEVTWGAIWNASEWQIARTRNELIKGSDAFYEAVKVLFAEVVDQTQVVDGVLQRSQIMRSSNALARQMTNFMGEPLMNINLAIRAYETWRYESDPKQRSAAKKVLARSVAALLASSVTVAFAQSLADAARDDDEEKDYWERVWKAFIGLNGDEETWKEYFKAIALGGNIVNAVNPANMIPVMSDIMSLLQGYTVERMDAGAFGDFLTAAKQVIKSFSGEGKWDPAYATAKMLTTGAKLLGSQSYNIMRDVEALVRTISTAFGGTEAQYQIDSKIYNVENQKSRFLNILYQLYKEGNMDAYRDIVQDMIDEGIAPSDIESGMKSRAKKDNYSAGYLDKDSFSVGIELKLPTEKKEEDEFTLDNLTSTQYAQYSEEHGAMLEGIVDEFQRRGFGSLDTETANALLSAAYTYAEETALEDASGGQYESDVQWVNYAQDADELGMTAAEYIWVKGTHDASITADGVYDAYKEGVEVEKYLTFRDLVNDLEPGVDYEKGDTESRKAAIRMLLMEIPGLTQDEYDYLYGTEYKSSGGFGGGFGGSFGGSGFGSSGFGKKFGK